VLINVNRGLERCWATPDRTMPVGTRFACVRCRKRRRLENEQTLSRRLRKVDLFAQLGFSERFAAQPRGVAAFPAADHVVVVWPEALHRGRAPEGRTVVVFPGVFVRSFTIEIHPGATQMAAGRVWEATMGNSFESVSIIECRLVKPPPSSDCRQPPRAPASRRFW
jgi:hypothetical protein